VCPKSSRGRFHSRVASLSQAGHRGPVVGAVALSEAGALVFLFACWLAVVAVVLVLLSK
jgi:hypothetical protein